jgi:uncharacterized membrane protein
MRVIIFSTVIDCGLEKGNLNNLYNLLHQILQLHEMLSNKIPTTDYVGKSINMFWDGIFHFFYLMVVLVGLILMWRLLERKNIDRSGRLLGGGLLLGWGLFNVVEGIINHQVLKLHNVVEFTSNHQIGNLAFLGFSIMMLVAGYAWVNRDQNPKPPAITLR